MSTEELIAVIAERRGKSFDKTFHEELLSRVTFWRAKLLRDTLNGRAFDRKWFIQSVLFPVERIKTGSTNDYIVRTVDVVPRPLRVNNILFDFVGPKSKERSFGFIHSLRIPYLKYSVYTSKETRYTYDGKINLYGKDRPNPLLVEGIFSDPRQLKSFESPTGDVAYDDDHYPIDPEQAQLIADYIVRFDLNEEPRQVKKDEITMNNENV